MARSETRPRAIGAAARRLAPCTTTQWPGVDFAPGLRVVQRAAQRRAARDGYGIIAVLIVLV